MAKGDSHRETVVDLALLVDRSLSKRNDCQDTLESCRMQRSGPAGGDGLSEALPGEVNGDHRSFVDLTFDRFVGIVSPLEGLHRLPFPGLQRASF